MAEYVLPLQQLIDAFRKLPGIGSKTAARLAFAVLNFTEEEAEQYLDMGIDTILTNQYRLVAPVVEKRRK